MYKNSQKRVDRKPVTEQEEQENVEKLIKGFEQRLEELEIALHNLVDGGQLTQEQKDLATQSKEQVDELRKEIKESSSKKALALSVAGKVVKGVTALTTLLLKILDLAGKEKAKEIVQEILEWLGRDGTG